MSLFAISEIFPTILKYSFHFLPFVSQIHFFFFSYNLNTVMARLWLIMIKINFFSVYSWQSFFQSISVILQGLIFFWSTFGFFSPVTIWGSNQVDEILISALSTFYDKKWKLDSTRKRRGGYIVKNRNIFSYAQSIEH